MLRKSSLSHPGFDVVIVGAGPGGLSAGMYLARAGFKTVIVDRDAPGGSARWIEKIENYPGFPKGICGARLMWLFYAQAKRWKARFVRDEVCCVRRVPGMWSVECAKVRLPARCVIACSGTVAKDAAIPGAQKFLGKGFYVEPFAYQPKRKACVAVIGSGEAAAHRAIELSRRAKRVYLVSRGRVLRAHGLLKERLAARDNIVHLTHCEVAALTGGRLLAGIKIRDNALGKTRSLGVSAVLALVGRQPSTLARRGRGDGYFEAGDMTGALERQVAIASGQGMAVAMRAARYLRDYEDYRTA
ncbi:MAG: NAD(P)/FAD-dependent oxidoreductase [Elusimicrobiota bacterium]